MKQSSFDQFLEYELIHLGKVSIKVHMLMGILIVLISYWLILWITRRVIRRQEKKRGIDHGRGAAFYQISKYFLIVLSILICLEILGVSITLLLAGSAALLVGLGLGIQQIFQDIVSGIILLSEGTVTINDVIEVDGIVGTVKHIRIRTSELLTRDNIIIVVPNSKLLSNTVINWTHNRESTRFHIDVGVAYGSDVKLVEKVLIESTKAHDKVLANPAPVVRFDGFGDSSLNFKIFFWSNEMFHIEFVKSDIRFNIDANFRSNQITIPFPQRDVHIKR